jgi:hypothetical protein
MKQRRFSPGRSVLSALARWFRPGWRFWSILPERLQTFRATLRRWRDPWTRSGSVTPTELALVQFEERFQPNDLTHTLMPTLFGTSLALFAPAPSALVLPKADASSGSVASPPLYTGGQPLQSLFDLLATNRSSGQQPAQPVTTPSVQLSPAGITGMAGAGDVQAGVWSPDDRLYNPFTDHDQPAVPSVPPMTGSGGGGGGGRWWRRQWWWVSCAVVGAAADAGRCGGLGQPAFPPHQCCHRHDYQ